MERRTLLGLLAITIPEIIFAKKMTITEAIMVTEDQEEINSLILDFVKDNKSSSKDIKYISKEKHKPTIKKSIGEKILTFENPHTGEKSKILFMKNGYWVKEGLEAFNYLARDFRTNQVVYMDKKLLDIIYNTKKISNSHSNIFLLSGYRSKKTNKKVGGVKNSFHPKGKALDFTLSDRSSYKIAKAARGLKAGGVGKYDKSHFIHVDTGPVRSWQG